MSLQESYHNQKKTKMYNFRMDGDDDKLFNELKSQFGFKELSAFIRFLIRNSDLQRKYQEKQNQVGKGIETVDSKLDKVLILLDKWKTSKNEEIRISPELRRSLSRESFIEEKSGGGMKG